MTYAEAAGRLEGSERCGVAYCPAHPDREGKHKSLSLRQGSDGSAIVHCFSGCHPRDIFRALRGGEIVSTDIRHVNEGPSDSERIEMARRIWSEASGATGTPAQVYLQSRGIAIAIPPSIRFAANLWHSPNVYAPTLVAAVQSPSASITGIQRIYLKADGSGKADLEPAKKSLGQCVGGAVRLARAGDTLVLAEGIETGLSVIQATGLPVWVALGTSGLRAMQLPNQVRDVIIAADNDVNNAGQRAAQDAAAKFISEGRCVRIAMPQTPGTDFNDSLQAMQ
jgi:phage/plasmid primase-like uncharacterized protein